MFNKLIRFIKRPLVGEQTTERLAYQQYQGYSLSDVRGNGGHNVLRTMAATSFAGIAPGPTEKPVDPTATGNPSRSIILQPLSDNGASF